MGISDRTPTSGPHGYTCMVWHFAFGRPGRMGIYLYGLTVRVRSGSFIEYKQIRCCLYLQMIKIKQTLLFIVSKWASSWEKGPTHYAVCVPSNAHAPQSSGVRSPALCLKLLPVPYIMLANSEGSGETARMRRLAWVFTVCIYDKYRFHMSWLKLLCVRWIFNGCEVLIERTIMVLFLAYSSFDNCFWTWTSVVLSIYAKITTFFDQEKFGTAPPYTSTSKRLEELTWKWRQDVKKWRQIVKIIILT